MIKIFPEVIEYERQNFYSKISSTVLTFQIVISFFSCTRVDDQPLNIVFINVDDLGWTGVGCYGSTYHETPNFDQLATDGMLFTNAYSSAAVCSPTRAAIVTGKYPARIGITNLIAARFQGAVVPEDKINPYGYEGGERQKLLTPVNPLWMELDEVTIAEALKPAGYSSGHVGKWHLGLDGWFPEDQGFDFNAGGCDYGKPPSFLIPMFVMQVGIGLAKKLSTVFQHWNQEKKVNT